MKFILKVWVVRRTPKNQQLAKVEEELFKFRTESVNLAVQKANVILEEVMTKYKVDIDCIDSELYQELCGWRGFPSNLVYGS